jgi:phage terminase small subunit
MTARKPPPPPFVPPDPPEGLSPRAKELWTLATNRPTSPGRLVAIEQALRSFDLAEEARRQLREQGLTTTTKTTGTVHVNPLAKIERDNRASFISVWTALHLHWPDDGGI